jgi:acyl-CoA dehydrogenase
VVFRALLGFIRRRNLLPRLSTTERQALEAGTVWVDRELFSGRPDLGRMLAEPWPELTPEERAFLDGPVEEVCRRVDPWHLTQTRELPPEVWSFLREHRFFGLAIPAEHGGLGFSPLAQSAVYAKLASRSLALSTVVLIPNSVGPGELLLAHGTPEQRRRWLPRLAAGDEIPCFALTEPGAGSDAASVASRGTTFRAADGSPAIRLDWDKRYITLAPVATLLGLAFRLDDPEELLGRGREPGLTLALVPTALPGVEIGDYHDAMGVPLPNGPTRGRGVVVPADAIIGGPDGAGRGWRMLMEALAGGRAVSLPAQSVGGAKTVARVAGAWAAVREQFGSEIGAFEGVREPLARIAGLTYMMEAARVYTCGAVGAGHRPAVVSALVKYRSTELLREVVRDGMDVLAGAGLVRGPSNPLGDAWAAVPIGITVEGANILTRTLIAFGQGTVRSHPWIGRATAAVEAGDAAELRRAVLGHLVALVRNTGRAALLSVTRGRLARSPVAGPTARSFRRLAWASATFAVLADTALFGLGQRLKRREALSGRFADALSWMYFGFAALKRFEAEGRPAADLPLVRWAADHALARVQEAFEGALANLDAPLLAWWLRGPASWWVRGNRLGAPPSDALGTAAAAVLTTPGEARDRLTSGIHTPTGEEEGRGRLEAAFDLVHRARPARARVDEAVRRGRLPRGPHGERVDAALAAGLVDEGEADLLRRTAAARARAVEVDSFAPHELLGRPPARPAGASAGVAWTRSA